MLVAIRENEQRARFIGYPTNRYKLLGFMISATVVGLAGVLLGLQPPLRLGRAALRRVLGRAPRHGGHRRHAQLPRARRSGALFFILFREFLSIWTPNWLFYFGLLFVGFIVFSPTGLVGVAQRLLAPFRQGGVEEAAMAGRTLSDEPLPPFLKPARPCRRRRSWRRAASPRASAASRPCRASTSRCATARLHALIGPNGAGKTTAFNLISGMFPPDEGEVLLRGRSIAGLSPEAITPAGIGRSFQITNLFPALSTSRRTSASPCRRATRALRSLGGGARDRRRSKRETAAVIRYLGLAGIERAEAGALSYGGQRLLDMGLALATRPRVLLLDEPLAGLAAAERERIGDLIKRISAEMPVLLVEHDIDRVFQLADAVTVMNEGEVLVDGTVEDARSSPSVQEVYIGSGAATLAAKPRAERRRARDVLAVDRVNTFYGKSHILRDVSFDVREHEIVALLGRNGAGKSTLLKTIIGIAPPASGSITLAGGRSPAGRRPRSRGSASATCRRAAGSSPA